MNAEAQRSRDDPISGLRACMVVYSHYPDDPRVSREARTLVRAGVEVDVVCLKRLGQPSREEADGVRTIRIPLATQRGSRLRYAWQYTAFLLLATAVVTRAWCQRRYSLIHVHSLPDFLVFSSALPRTLGARVILDLHEAMPELVAARFHLDPHATLIRVAKAIERISAAFADEVFVVNDVIRDLLASRGIPLSKMVVIPNSPDESSIAPPHRQLLSLRYGLRGARGIVVAGGLNQERDLETLIRCLTMPPMAGSLDLLLLGRGEAAYVDRLRSLVQELSLGDRVVFGGFVPHKEALELLSLSDVGVVTFVDNPITRLGLPNRMFEYAMLGKPLVVPRLPAIESFVGLNGYYYRPGDPGDLANAISRALSDGISVKRGFERPDREWRWYFVSGRLLEAYRRARTSTLRFPGRQVPCT